MIACFVDTFYYFALLNPRDDAHSAAKTLTSTLNRPLVTTAWVLTELGDGLADTPARTLFAPLVRQMISSAQMTVVAPEQRLFDQSIQLYEQRPDKNRSLTDCMSMMTMRERGIVDILTGDHHFRQAGFNLLFE